MQQLKIAQNNIYEKVINNLLNNITGQQAAYIISKVPDYFSLVQQGELKKQEQRLEDKKIIRQQDVQEIQRIIKWLQQIEEKILKPLKIIPLFEEKPIIFQKIAQSIRCKESIQTHSLNSKWSRDTQYSFRIITSLWQLIHQSY
ncbi:hypothetical protein ABPG72_020090 [Tetrahymena utriculariae]